MCGILGLIGTGVNSTCHDKLKLLSHRGPDNSGYYSSENIFLGHQRLSIQDLSENASQPMFSKDQRFVIIFNGEIYNHWELRNQYLKNYNFISSSDTETILYLYIEYGDVFLNFLNGIFALCIFDTYSGKIFIARDFFGVKPLYYHLSNTQLLFSSELKSIIEFTQENKELDFEALFNYLYFLWSPGSSTPLLNYKKLLPGHYLSGYVNDLSNVKILKYYEIPFNCKKLNISETLLIDKLDNILTSAVERQLLSDVPVGFFLSGGLDSSLLVAIAKKRFPENDFTCFTINTNFETKIDNFESDLPYAKKVASHLGVKLEIVDANINIIDDFDKLIWHLDEPQADPAPLNVLNICKKAKDLGFSVLLGGSGGDDLFSGYRRHQHLYYSSKIKWIPLFIKRAIYFLLSHVESNSNFFRRLKKFFSFYNENSVNDRFVSPYGWLKKEDLLKIFSPKYRERLINYNPNDILIKSLENICINEDELNKMLFLEMKYFLTDHNLNYTDKLSMAVGVEVRVPYLDKELVEFSTQIPVNYKLRGITTKYILKKVAERYLPKDIIYRSKSGFGAPVRDWVVNDLSEFINKKLSINQIEKRGIFDFDSVQNLINENKLNKVDASYTIWALISIESWLCQFID